MENTTRFSNRVDDYVKYRPHYPQEIVNCLQQEYNSTPDKVIADIGAGTGISSELFLTAGYRVIAVEPNKEMRDKSVELLSSYPAFTAVDGTAEHTTLPDHSVDAVVAGQAFHWFDREKCRTEFKRVLRRDGLVVLIWNERKNASLFELDYDALIMKHGIDYKQVNHRNIDFQDIADFCAPSLVTLHQFKNEQRFNFEGLLGRLSSSSYMPAKGDPGYTPMVDDLEHLFKHHQQNDSVVIEYDTSVFVARF